MEQLIVPEQDVANAVCLLIARDARIMPDDVEVELMYDDLTGFTAEAFANGYKYELSTVRLIEALRIWIDQYMNMNPLSAGIDLQLHDEEGIIAIVR